MSHILDSRILEEKQVKAIVEDLGRLCSETNRGFMREVFVLSSKELFESDVLSKLGTLPGCTSSDLTNIFRNEIQRVDATSKDFSSRFAAAVRKAVAMKRRSGPLALQPAGRLRISPDRPWTDFELWRSEDQRFAVTIIGLLPANRAVQDSDDYDVDALHGVTSRNLFVIVEGVATEGYFAQFCTLIVEVTSTLLRCLTMLNMRLFSDFCDHLYAAANKSDSNSSGPTEGALAEFANDYRVANTIIKNNNVAPQFAFVKDAVRVFFLDTPSKKATKHLSGRIKNSLRLLMEADRQPENGIGLALSVSAIESLISSGKDDMSREFCEFVGVLLEPSLDQRLGAEKWAKKVYDRRSKTLHGSELDCTIKEARDARLLAAAFLKAFLERYAAMRRIGNEEKPEDLLHEIKDGKYRSTGLTHSEHIKIDWPWRKCDRQVE